MSNKTTIANNLNGTLATTVDGDFVETNIEAGKSAVILNSAGTTYPANKKRAMSKPTMFKPKGGIGSSEEAVWVYLVHYRQIPVLANDWVGLADVYVCPVGDEDTTIKNPSVESLELTFTFSSANNSDTFFCPFIGS